MSNHLVNINDRNLLDLVNYYQLPSLQETFDKRKQGIFLVQNSDIIHFIGYGFGDSFQDDKIDRDWSDYPVKYELEIFSQSEYSIADFQELLITALAKKLKIEVQAVSDGYTIVSPFDTLAIAQSEYAHAVVGVGTPTGSKSFLMKADPYVLERAKIVKEAK